MGAVVGGDTCSEEMNWLGCVKGAAGARFIVKVGATGGSGDGTTLGTGGITTLGNGIVTNLGGGVRVVA